jgi:hypothetical protein
MLASSPCALPWRDAPGGPDAIPVSMRARSALFRFPSGRLTIDSKHVSFGGCFWKREYGIEDVLGAKVRAYESASFSSVACLSLVICFRMK